MLFRSAEASGSTGWTCAVSTRERSEGRATPDTCREGHNAASVVYGRARRCALQSIAQGILQTPRRAGKGQEGRTHRCGEKARDPGQHDHQRRSTLDAKDRLTFKTDALSLSCERRPRLRFDWRRCTGGAGGLVFALLAATPPVGVAPCKGAVSCLAAARRCSCNDIILTGDGADAPACLWPSPKRGIGGASG